MKVNLRHKMNPNTTSKSLDIVSILTLIRLEKSFCIIILGSTHDFKVALDST